MHGFQETSGTLLFAMAGEQAFLITSSLGLLLQVQQAYWKGFAHPDPHGQPQGVRHYNKNGEPQTKQTCYQTTYIQFDLEDQTLPKYNVQSDGRLWQLQQLWKYRNLSAVRE